MARRPVAIGLVATCLVVVLGLAALVFLRTPDEEEGQPLCGVADMKSVTAPTSPAPANAVHKVAGGFRVSSLTVANGELVSVDHETKTVRRLGLDGQALGSFSVGFQLAAPNVVVDGAKNLYLAQYPGTLVKLSPTGQTLWTRTGMVKQQIDAVFGIGTGPAFRIGVVGRGEADSALFDPSGAAVGRSPVRGTAFSPTSDGGVVATDGRYVRRYDSAGRQVQVFGDTRVGERDAVPTGGPLHFYQQGGAVLAPDASFYVADATRGIHATTPEGFYRGRANDDTVGYLTERSEMTLAGERLYFAAGGRFNANQHISWVSLSDLGALVGAPKPPEPVLGFGAGVLSGVTGNYFAPGRTPAATASFDPWWATQASKLRLSYVVRSRDQILAGTAPAPTVMALPTTAAGLASIPLALPPARPGAYEVDARLLKADGSVAGATCLRYTVGAPGHRLDFSALPPGAGYGGPAPARGVALADQLGTGGLRARVEWSKLLPDPAGPMNFSAYDAELTAAADEAAKRGVALWVQVGEGGATEKTLVQNGTWEKRVGELVAHYKSTIRAWEAWNEPNNTFGPASSYVSQVLAPFSRAVKGADPGAKVVGASVLGMNLAYFDAIGAAGGYALMDVVGIHPYTGHNRSYEEQATPAAIAQLKEIMARYGAGAKPIWNTESAWWADGPGNYLAQADKVARGLIWNRALGIERWSYFLIEGGFGRPGSYSLIQSAAQPDDYVKPGALGSMTAAAQISGRPFVAMADVGIPHAYAASFGARPGTTDSMLAAWTDDMAVTAHLFADGTSAPVNVTVTDVLGASRTLSVSPGVATPLALSGSPQYVVAPGGARLRLAPTKAFGANVAAASAGASATASSANAANPASKAIDNKADAAGGGDIPGLPAWASAPGDDTPSLTVRLAQAKSLDRVVVSSHSVGSVVPGLRSYDVAVQDGTGNWTTVGQVRDQFFSHRQVVTFAPRTATAIRISVSTVNYGGLAGGLKPWFWPSDATSLSNASLPWYGPAVVYELAAYESGTTTQPPPASGRGTFKPVTPARVLDTRNGTGQGGRAQKVGAGQTITVDVTGAGGIPPAGVAAVVMNVTTTEASAPSFLSVTPSGGHSTSSLNFVPGLDVANLVTVPVAPDGNVRVYNNTGATHVLFDVVGWYGDATAAPGARHTAVNPARILDTRNGTGRSGATTKVGAGQTITLDVTGPGGVPSTGVSAVTMNVTATEASAPSFVSVTPSGGNSTSSLNFPPGRDVPNLVTVPVGADGSVRIYNNAGATHVVADVMGWYSSSGATSGAVYTPVAPARIVDTRYGTGTGGVRSPVGAGQTLTADVTGPGGVPTTGVSAVVLNATVTQPSAAGFVSITPNGGHLTSNLNFVPGQDVPNLVVVPVGSDGNIRAYNLAGTTHLVYDVVGWFSAPTS